MTHHYKNVILIVTAIYLPDLQHRHHKDRHTAHYFPGICMPMLHPLQEAPGKQVYQNSMLVALLSDVI